jgi:hypothetical protein
MITIISEKYGIPEEDIFNTVRADPRFGSLVTAPVVQSMGYFDEDELSAAMTKMSVKSAAETATGGAAANVIVAAVEPAARVAAKLPAPATKKVLKKPLKKKVISLDDE